MHFNAFEFHSKDINYENVKLILASTSSLLFVVSKRLLRGGVGEGGWVLPYNDSTGMHRATAPTPIFRLWPLLKTTFSTWAAPKGPLFKNVQFFVPLFRLGQIEKTLVLKNIRFFVIFSSKIPCFPLSGRSESPTFSARGRSLAPHCKPCATHIYQFHI